MNIVFRTAAALCVTIWVPFAATAQDVTPDEAREIAKEAYVYGFPIVDKYRIEHAYFVDRSGPEFVADWNTIANFARVFTSADTTVQTPNSDTPYSFVGLDLRAEPMVLTMPVIDKDRYFSVQLNDAYTFNFDFIGSRTTGNGGGSYLVAGPEWQGEVPAGIAKVFRSETNFVLALYRTQLFDPQDIDNVKKVQAGYKVQPLSAFLGTPAPVAAPVLTFIPALTPEQQRTDLQFFNILNFVLGQSPVYPGETDLMAKFGRIGVGPGKSIDPASLSPEMTAALQGGMADAWAELAEFTKTQVNTGKVTSGDVFGTRAFLDGNYMYRFAGAVLGILGLSKEEAMYPIYRVDSSGAALDGAKAYTLHFAKDALPPVNSFWSLTMYKLPESLLSANPINRYLLNSPMLPQFKTDADGGLTFYIQRQSPGAEKQANWLPAPDGPFTVVLRMYWPKEPALNGTWVEPQIEVAQ